MKTYLYKVEGRVQGVGFRAYVLQQARKMDLDGYVRNLADGSVEVQAKARDQQTIERLEKILQKGPVMSEVKNISRREVSSTATQKGFHIR